MLQGKSAIVTASASGIGLGGGWTVQLEAS